MQMDEEHFENSEGSLPCSEWLCGLALKRFENADNVFDALNNRAGLLIGYSGFCFDVGADIYVDCVLFNSSYAGC